MRYAIIGLLIFVSTCGRKQNQSKPIELYSWIDQTRVREFPDFKKKAIGNLREGERVFWSGKKSRNVTRVKLRNHYFKYPFFRIRRENGQEGWVYGGALSRISPPEIEKKRNLSALGFPLAGLVYDNRPGEHFSCFSYRNSVILLDWEKGTLWGSKSGSDNLLQACREAEKNIPVGPYPTAVQFLEPFLFLDTGTDATQRKIEIINLDTAKIESSQEYISSHSESKSYTIVENGFRISIADGSCTKNCAEKIERSCLDRIFQQRGITLADNFSCAKACNAQFGGLGGTAIMFEMDYSVKDQQLIKSFTGKAVCADF